VSRLGNTKCLVDGQILIPSDVVVRAADERDCVPALAAVKAPRCARPLRADSLDRSSTPARRADVVGGDVCVTISTGKSRHERRRKSFKDERCPGTPCARARE